jgi:uncharacterized protein (DUF1015 family)
MPTVDDDLPSGLSPEEFSAWIFGAAEPSDDAGLELAPFRGVRFDPEVVGDLAAVTTPPYDLIDDEAVRRLRAGDVHSVVRLILPDPDPPGYSGASRALRSWLAEGALVTARSPSLYVYEQVGGGSVQRGLIGGVGLRPESAKVVLPHENVFAGPVRDRLALMAATRANLEPIFLLYEGGADAAQIIDSRADGSPPISEVTAEDGVVHRLWRVGEPELHTRISLDLRGRQALIADGHHRYATYRVLQARHHAAGDGPGPWDYGLALLVDSVRYPPRLGAIHRVLPTLAPETAVERARSVFRVSEVTGPLPDALATLTDAPRPAFLLAGGSRMWLLTAPNAAVSGPHSERWRRLDTAVLDQLLIEGVWDLPENERSVEVVHHDAAAAIRRADRSGGTAVILNPLRVEDVLAVAADGERVPRKSTSFGPKPRSGLIMRLLDT